MTCPRDALKGKAPQRRPQKRLDRRLQEVTKAVGGGYCRLQMPLKLALAVRGTAAGHRLGALEGGGGYPPACAVWDAPSKPHNLPRSRSVLAQKTSLKLPGKGSDGRKR